MATGTLAGNSKTMIVVGTKKSNSIGMAHITLLSCRNMHSGHVNRNNPLPFYVATVAITRRAFEYAANVATAAICNRVRPGQRKTCRHVVKTRLSIVSRIDDVRLCGL